ncbi:MAG TPA: hypothetical protein VER58_20345 [Thermoanaerobaculia bacterium]|nr:hypothetical protein [Thermoanaerobaculia bacterium]
MFDEVRVYDGIAERTGTVVDHETVRGSKLVCYTISELTRRVRRDGDGTFYLAAEAWPENTERIDLNTKWTPMG